MKNLFSLLDFRRPALVVAVLLTATAAAVPADAGCLNPRETQQAIRSGKAISIPQVLRQNGIPANRNTILGRARLCEAGGRYYWTIKVDWPPGHPQVVNLPAG